MVKIILSFLKIFLQLLQKSLHWIFLNRLCPGNQKILNELVFFCNVFHFSLKGWLQRGSLLLGYLYFALQDSLEVFNLILQISLHILVFEVQNMFVLPVSLHFSHQRFHHLLLLNNLILFWNYFLIQCVNPIFIGLYWFLNLFDGRSIVNVWLIIGFIVVLLSELSIFNF